MARRVISDLFGSAGLTVNGDGPGDPKIHDKRFYSRVLAQGSLGLGESYMDGWWDADPLDEFFTKLLRARLDERLKPFKTLLPYLKAVFVNLQTPRKAHAVADVHYDLGSDFFVDMLGRRLIYTCGYWDGARDLNEAQENKCDLVCRKVGLKQGDTVLDLGCGWGGFAMFAAERYGASVTGVNISDSQVAYADKNRGDLPVRFVCEDWRKADGVYDHVVAIGLFEHVGYRNYRRCMEDVSERLNDDGLFLLHTVGRNTSTVAVDPWINRYVFPNGMLPSIKQIALAAEGVFVVEDFHSLGPHYDRTLMAWHENFSMSWHKHREQFGERFRRMWSYYLLSCAGSFRARSIQLWQFVLSKRGVAQGYVAVR